MSDYLVTLVDDDSPADMYVLFHGPKDSELAFRPAASPLA